MTRKGDQFEVDQDLAFQRRDWIFERVGWAALALVVVAGASGLLGRGPVSERIVETPDRLARIELGRFERHGAPARLIVTARRRTAQDTSVQIWIDGRYLDGITVEAVSPEPMSQASDASRTVFELALPHGADSTRVVFQFTPDALWARVAQLGVVGGQAASLGQFIFP